jgi:hypothetical protein
MLLPSNCRYSCGVNLFRAFPASRIEKDFALTPLAGLLFQVISNPVKMPLRVLIIEAVGTISEEISGSYKVWDLICYLMINWILWPGFILFALGS